jgi:serine/threonine protein kinase
MVKRDQSLIDAANEILSDILIRGSLERRFTVITPISSGSYGKVYEAIDHQEDERIVAVKISHSSDDEKTDALFKKEAEILNRYPHRDIVRIFGHYVARRKSVLVMEFAENDLDVVLENPSINFDLEDIIKFLDPVSKATDYLHSIGAGASLVTHRDIKPSNILIFEGGAVKLGDLGQAGFGGTASTARGTMPYRAPEGFPNSGENRFYPESDIYSIAVVALQILTRRTPFQGIDNEIECLKRKKELTISDLVGVDSEMAEILFKGMHPSYKQRFHSAREFMDALKSIGTTKVNRGAVRRADEVSFDSLYTRLTGALRREYTGKYGTTALEDIDEMYSLLDNIHDVAKRLGLEKDPQLIEVTEGYHAREKHDREIMRELLEKHAKDWFKGEMLEMKYDLFAVAHCWGPPTSYERLNKAQIDDGTYKVHYENDFSRDSLPKHLRAK